MALVKCSECGKEISDKASACPNCACPIEKPKKKVRVIKKGALALRCSVFVDNQVVGQLGVGATKYIELNIPIGTHYIGVSTQVRHEMNTFAPANAISQEQDGKQFEIQDDDELIEIEVLTKGSFTGSTGRCIIGNINKYNQSELQTKLEEYKTSDTKQEIKNNISNTILNVAIYLVIAIIILFLLKIFL